MKDFVSRRQLRAAALPKQLKTPRATTTGLGQRPPVPKRGELQGLLRPVHKRPPSWDLGPEGNINRLNPEVERERLEIIQRHKAKAAQWPEQKDEELKCMQDLLEEFRTVQQRQEDEELEAFYKTREKADIVLSESQAAFKALNLTDFELLMHEYHHVCNGLNEFHKRLPGLPPQTVTVVSERASKELHDVSNRYYGSRRKEVLRTIESLGQVSYDGSHDQLSPVGLMYGSNASPSPLERPIHHQTQNYLQPGSGRRSLSRDSTQAGPTILAWQSPAVSPNSSTSRLSRLGADKEGAPFISGAQPLAMYSASRPKTAGSFGIGAAYPTPPNTAPTTVGRFSRPPSTFSAVTGGLVLPATTSGPGSVTEAAETSALRGQTRRNRTLTFRHGTLVPNAATK